MLIIGCDYHPSVQQTAWVDTETGDCGERRLVHENGEAERFYRELKKKGVSVRVGMEATGHSRWFERLLGELNYELWVGNPAEIRAKRVRKQRNDRFDAQHILKLMLENNFPRIWVPTPENRDVRQLVMHRHRLVGMRTRVMNQLQAIAMNEGVRRKSGLWGNALMRFLLVEAAQTVARCEPEWRQRYFHLALRRGRAIATVALARKLAVRLFWMWHKGQDYQQVKKFGSDTGQLEVPNGVKSITVKVIERPAPSVA